MRVINLCIILSMVIVHLNRVMDPSKELQKLYCQNPGDNTH